MPPVTPPVKDDSYGHDGYYDGAMDPQGDDYYYEGGYDSKYAAKDWKKGHKVR